MNKLLMYGLSVFTFLVVTFSSCSHYIADPFPDALGSNDLTLVIRSCDGPIYAGFGICRAKVGTSVASSWQAILPKASGIIYDGELSVQVNDVVKTYGITGQVVNVPLADFYGPTWQPKDNSIMNATATLRLKLPTGIESVLQVEGQVLVRSLAVGYEPLAIDSGYESFETNCRVQYSTSGRSAVKCK